MNQHSTLALHWREGEDKQGMGAGWIRKRWKEKWREPTACEEKKRGERGKNRRAVMI